MLRLFENQSADSILLGKMKLAFSKYQGTGNDFVMIDALNIAPFQLSNEQIQKICDRRFGIGADGLIMLRSSQEFDFEMDYYNSDGSKSFCGNGARCTVQFARQVGKIENQCRFTAIDGVHEAKFEGDIIALKMNEVKEVKSFGDGDFFIHTGSPHYLRFSNDLSHENVVNIGKSIRYNATFKVEGTNVNLIQRIEKNVIQIGTYERGVEDETFSCGTGATAAALLEAYLTESIEGTINVKVKGGDLFVRFRQPEKGKFSDIYLIGPAKAVFHGVVEI